MATFAEAMEEARKFFRAGELRQSEAIYRQIVAAAPQSGEAWNELGLVLMQSNQLESAAECLRRAVGLDRTAPLYHINLAVACRMLNRPREAVASFGEALKFTPATPEILTHLAICLRETGETTQALIVFDEALRIRPDYAAAHFHRGNLQLAERWLMDAAASFQRVVELKPDDPFAHCKLGLVFGKMSHSRTDRLGTTAAPPGHDELQTKRDYLQRAIGCFRRALELKPDLAEANRHIASALADECTVVEAHETFQRGQALLAGGQLDEAAACFEQVLAQYPHVVETHYALGLVRVKQAQTRAAIASFRQAIALEPTHALASHQLALALIGEDRLEEAVACLEQVLQDHPDSTAARATLDSVQVQSNARRYTATQLRMPFLRELQAAERQVSSQNGEDGVLDLLFGALGTTNKFFVEFGCGNGAECNGAYLIQQGWTGVQMDGEYASVNPRAVVHKEFITAENVNDIFRKHGVPDAFDLLSIDIDGNDFWVWRAIASRPRVVLIEYNASVPPMERLTVPYDPALAWAGTDFFGASLRALKELGEQKGYVLVYCDRCGVNAFFVARDLLPYGFEPLSIEEIYKLPNYCDMGLCHPRETVRKMIDPFAEVAIRHSEINRLELD